MALLGIIAAIAGITGAAEEMNASLTNYHAREAEYASQDIVRKSNRKLLAERKKTNDMLELLGKQKINLLENSIPEFLECFSKIKNVDFSDVFDGNDLLDAPLNYTEIEDLRKMSSFASRFLKDALLMGSTDALLSIGAMGITKTVTKTVADTVVVLSDVVSSNLSLAFIGGKTIEAGIVGLSGGEATLLGLKFAGPALLVTGFVANLNAKTNLDNASADLAQAHQIKEQLFAAADVCNNISKRAEQFCLILDRLDTLFISAIQDMKQIVAQEGTQYNKYSQESRKKIAFAASLAVSVKSVIDVDVIDPDGNLTAESDEVFEWTNRFVSTFSGPMEELVQEESVKEKPQIALLEFNNEFAETDSLHDIVSKYRKKYSFEYAYVSILGKIEFMLDHQDKKVLKYLRLNNSYEEILLMYQKGIIRVNKGFVLTDLYLYDIASGDNVSLKDIAKLTYGNDVISVTDLSGKKHEFCCDMIDRDGHNMAKMLKDIIEEINKCT